MRDGIFSEHGEEGKSFPVLTLTKIIDGGNARYFTSFEGKRLGHGDYSHDDSEIEPNNGIVRRLIEIHQSYIDVTHTVQIEVIRIRKERDHSAEAELKKILGY